MYQSYQPSAHNIANDRRSDKIITRLRMGDNGLKGIRSLKSNVDENCTHCTDMEMEDYWHYFFTCPAHATASVELEAIVLKYNIRPDPYGLTFPPQKSANEVYNAILEYVKATGYWILDSFILFPLGSFIPP